MKKALTLFMLVSLLLCTAACGTTSSDATATPDAPSQSPDATATPVPETPWEGKTITLNGAEAEVSFDSGAQTDNSAHIPAFTVETETVMTLASAYSENFNYYTLQIKSSQPLWGVVSYTNNGKSYEEEFFIESRTAEEDFQLFNSYIDGFMDGAQGSAVTAFKLINKGKEAASVQLSQIKLAQKEAVEDRVTLQNDYIKIGASLTFGGGLDYMEYLKEQVDAVRYNGRVEVGIDYAKLEGAELITSNVNLFNNYDPGRLVQQSYYGTSNPPYECGEFMGRKWNYNPVQGGDRGGYHSKIVDFEVTENHIYVKCRPMDWGKENSPTPSYMEATYTIDGRTMRVDNRFVDFSGYTHPTTNQELPALYVIEPLYTLVYIDSRTSWVDTSEMTYRDDLPFWDGTWENFRSRDSWWAWINGKDNGFGIGLYVPTATTVIGGMFSHDGTIKDTPDKASPTSYIAPLRQIALVSYLPLQYSYAVSVGNINEIRESFKALDDTKAIDNSSLKNYGRKKK